MECRDCETELAMRRKAGIGGVRIVWQCPECLLIPGPVPGRCYPEDPDALPWVKMKKKSQPNSKRRAYNAALKTARFKELRRLVIENAGGLCQRQGRNCTIEATQAGHLTYERLGNELLGDLEANCAACNAEERVERITRHVLGSK